MTQQSITTSISESVDEYRNQLTNRYSLRDPNEVCRFVAEHPYVYSVLMDIPKEVKKYFGPNPQVILELFYEPDAEDDCELFALVQTDLDPESARKKLDEFDEKWWLDNLDRSQCKLNIDLEYI